MREIILALALTLSAQGDLKSVTNNVEKSFSAMRTIKANFRQVFYDAAMGTIEESRGTLVLQKPLKMRWEYKTPEEQTIVSDGTFIYLYVPADKQVMAQRIGNLVSTRSPALFLAGEAKLSELFHIDLANDEIEGKIDGVVSLSLTPKVDSMNLTRIILRVGKKDAHIDSFSLFDWTGNRTDVFLTNATINGAVKEELFTFKTPQGVEEVQLPSMGNGAY